MEPSPQAMEAARDLLGVPQLLQIASIQLREITKGLDAVNNTLILLGSKLFSIEPTSTIPPQPQNYFLNEQHTTIVTKSQARKEAREKRQKQKTLAGLDELERVNKEVAASLPPRKGRAAAKALADQKRSAKKPPRTRSRKPAYGSRR